jgi:hypothetical protein
LAEVDRAPSFTLRTDDQFAGKPTKSAFETEQRPYAGSITQRLPEIAVSVCSKLDRKVLRGV